MENLLVVAGLAVILVRIVRTGYFFQLVQLTATLRTAETSLVKRLIIEVILFMIVLDELVTCVTVRDRVILVQVTGSVGGVMQRERRYVR